MRHAQTCWGACQECALPQASAVSGHVSSEVGAAGKENQESEALMLVPARYSEDYNGCRVADGFDKQENAIKTQLKTDLTS